MRPIFFRPMLLVAVLGLAAQADELRLLRDPIKIEAEGLPIEALSGHAAPFVFDVDNDGRKDLIVGEFEGGRARIYLNQGSDDEPRFSGFSYLQAGGGDAIMPSA